MSQGQSDSGQGSSQPLDLPASMLGGLGKSLMAFGQLCDEVKPLLTGDQANKDKQAISELQDQVAKLSEGHKSNFATKEDLESLKGDLGYAVKTIQEQVASLIDQIANRIQTAAQPGEATTSPDGDTADLKSHIQGTLKGMGLAETSVQSIMELTQHVGFGDAVLEAVDIAYSERREYPNEPTRIETKFIDDLKKAGLGDEANKKILGATSTKSVDAKPKDSTKAIKGPVHSQIVGLAR